MKKIMILNFPSLQLHSNLIWYFVFLVFIFTPAFSQAQTAQLLSVSPALFEMSAEPGQTWTSSLKVVNPNAYDLTVYVTVVNFAPRGEGGDGTLLPVLEKETEGVTLAEWVIVDTAPVIINKEGSVAVPFSVRVPDNAAPGGHFAALLVSTKPPENSLGAAELRTAQVVTSLFFLRVAGDVTEAGSIREFNTSESFYGSPRADFALRFENTGNVHLRPQGDITITNMWGQERGIIPINRQSHFGNVLPQSTRKFSFSWEGEWSLSDIGRYKAVVTLAYGQDARQFVTSVTYFWFVPLLPAVVTLGSLAVLVTLLIWLIRLYVRRLLIGAGYGHHARQPYVQVQRRSGDLELATMVVAHKTDTPKPSEALSSMLVRVISLLASRFRNVVKVTELVRRAKLLRYSELSLWQRVRRRWRLVLACTVVLVLLAGLIMFVRGALTPQRSYTVTYEGESGGQTVSSDEIIYEATRDNETIPPLPESNGGEGGLVVDIVNVSGVAGAAATVALLLETEGYTIGEVATNLGETQGRTVIVYEGDTGDSALALSQLLNNALLSAYNDDGGDTGASVTIYIGADIATEE